MERKDSFKFISRIVVISTIFIAILATIVGMLFSLILSELGPIPSEFFQDRSVTQKDNQERKLSTPEVASPVKPKQKNWRPPVKHTSVDQRYLHLLLIFEDRRFYSHGGIDISALVRATLQLVSNGRIISGGSTLTMQVARLIDRRYRRSARTKLLQMARALQLESKFTKAEILNLYLRLAPFGGPLEGVRDASLAYFGKEPRKLSLAQAALLVALPQSPERRRPDLYPEAARNGRDRVLDRAVRYGIITTLEAAQAKNEPIPTRRYRRHSLSKRTTHSSSLIVTHR